MIYIAPISRIESEAVNK